MNGQQATRRTWTILVLLLVVLIAIMMLLPGANRPETSRERCERLWRENESTAARGVMTRNQYVANCLDTERNLRDGRLDP